MNRNNQLQYTILPNREQESIRTIHVYEQFYVGFYKDEIPNYPSLEKSAASGKFAEGRFETILPAVVLRVLPSPVCS